MAVVRMRGTARTAWAHLSQGGMLKPTALWDLTASTLNEFWPAATGGSGNDFLAGTGVRTLLLQVAIERAARAVPDEHDLLVEVDTTLGRLPGPTPRFGGLDQMRLRDPRDGGVVASWHGWWLWFRTDEDGAISLLDQPAPGVIVDQDDVLAGAARPPGLERPEPGAEFRWTARETDTNDHVFSLAYLERAENALADHGLDTTALHHWRVWFLRPSFLGEQTTPEVDPGDGEWTVGLRNGARDQLSAVVRASTGGEGGHGRR